MVSALEGIQQDFNGSQSGGKAVSLADLIVLAGGVGVEQAAKAAGHDVQVPFTPGRADATQEQTDVDSFAVLEPTADGFRNYLQKGHDLAAEHLLLDKAFMLSLTAPELTVLVGGLRVLGANAGESTHGVLTDRPGHVDERLLRQPARHGHRMGGDVGHRGRVPGSRSRQTAPPAGPAPGWTSIFGANSELRALAEVYATNDAGSKFVARFRGGVDEGDEPRPVRHRLTRTHQSRKWSRCRAQRDTCSIFGWSSGSERDDGTCCDGRRCDEWPGGMQMTDTTSRLTVEGPITGGDHGWPFGRPLFDLAEHGYVEEEFFLSGDATTYRQAPGTEWGRDGHWSAEPNGTVPFTTRLLVYRPADPERFNGTDGRVAGTTSRPATSCSAARAPSSSTAYAVVGATVQRVGVTGFPTNSQGLAAWDPDALRLVEHPHRRRVVRHLHPASPAPSEPNRDRTGVDPLGGLDVQRVIGIGASQSAARLATYVNAIHPLEHAFDGYLLQIYFGAGTALEVGDAIVNINAPTAPGTGSRVGLRGTNVIRDDLDVPVMVVNSELEAIACYEVRQPDTDRFRYWESAGTCHVVDPVDGRAGAEVRARVRGARSR